jgi:sugar phosphate isomerase/epimerase
MTTIHGPAIFLAQFAGDVAPFNSLKTIAEWAASLGYEGVQIPSWDGRLFDLDRAADSDAYCDEVKATLAQAGNAAHRVIDAPAGPARRGTSGL